MGMKTIVKAKWLKSYDAKPESTGFLLGSIGYRNIGSRFILQKLEKGGFYEKTGFSSIGVCARVLGTAS